MILKLSLDLPEDGAYIPLTRQFGRTLLEYLKVVPEDIGDVETIVTELVANVIRHAHSASQRFQVTLDYYADRVVITVVDTGHGFSFRDVPEIGSSRPDMEGGTRLGGFGLPLLDAVSDRLQFFRTDPQGATVRAEKCLRYLTQQDSDDAVHMNDTGGGTVTLSGG